MTEPRRETAEREIIQDYRQHFEGEREIVNWTRPGYPSPAVQTFFNVPIMYLREVMREDFERVNPEKTVSPDAICFWEVSVD